MNPDYVTDVAYVRNFEGDLGPPRLRLVAALNGFPPPPAVDFAYCELGFGHGDTLVALAAANPRARFVGVDFIDEHVAFARGLAKKGGVDNFEVHQLDFSELPQHDLGAFDFVVAHGVLSWVGPDKRQAVFDFASSRLRPGGILYVSYNAMPGWAAIEPLRQLLRSGAAADGTLERARQGLALAKRMADANAEYFQQNPPARAMLGTLEKLGLSYLAHEYLHAHWDPMYFAQVARELAAWDLHFAGVQPLFLNFRDLSVPASTLPLFEDVTERGAFESLKDFAINEYFRRDVYVKGRPARAAAVTDAYLDQTPFGAPVEGVPAQRDVVLRHHTMHFEGAVFDALLSALAEGAQTGSALCARPELAPFGEGAVRAALTRLIVGAHAAPMQVSTRTNVQDALMFTVPLEYNRMILQQPVASELPIVLASTVAGTGIAIPALTAIAIRLLTEVQPSQRSAWIRKMFGRTEVKMQLAGRTIESAAERCRMVEGELDTFRRERLSKLVELGVLGSS